MRHRAIGPLLYGAVEGGMKKRGEEGEERGSQEWLNKKVKWVYHLYLEPAIQPRLRIRWAHMV